MTGVAAAAIRTELLEERVRMVDGPGQIERGGQSRGIEKNEELRPAPVLGARIRRHQQASSKRGGDE